MRKKILLALALVLFTASSTGLVYQNGSQPECPEGRMCITSAGGDSTNGEVENISVDLNVESKTCASGNASGSVRWGDYSKLESMPPQHQISFHGTVITSNPCQRLSYNVSRSNGIYWINVYSESASGICTQCVGAVRYNATVNARSEYFQLHVEHNGEEISSFAPPQKINEGGLAQKPQDGEEKGFIASIVRWFTGLF